MFAIIKVSRNNRYFSPVCYFSKNEESRAKQMFEAVSQGSDFRLLLIDNFDPNSNDYKQNMNIISSYKPPKKKPNPIRYESRTQIVKQNEQQKKIQQEEQKKKYEKIYSVPKIPKIEIFYFCYSLLDQKSKLIFISKVPWTLPYDKNRIHVTKEGIYNDRYLRLSCYAKTNAEAEKILKDYLKEYFKKIKG